MNSEEQFEQQLQRQPHRAVPREWRGEILSGARKAAASHDSALEPPLPRRLRTWLSALLWPHPRAWASLAFLWLVVLTLNFAAREPSPSHVSSQVTPPSRELRQLLQQQERLFAELAGQPEKPSA